MQIVLICGYCNKVHSEETKEGVLVVNFKQKQISFICQNKECRRDNIFSFDNWSDKVKHSPLPGIRIV